MRRWASCNILSTDDHAAAAIAVGGTPVLAVIGHTLTEYLDFINKSVILSEGENKILANIGDASIWRFSARCDGNWRAKNEMSDLVEALKSALRF
jgi:S-adenosylhomocysteine hydrolase